MSLYKVINQIDLKRLAEEEVKALDETDQSIIEINKLIENYQILIKCLDELPAKQNEKTMVPLGRVAYMPGRLVETNRVVISLGDSWFVETSTDHAKDIAKRRIKPLETFLDKLKEQRRLFETRSDYTEQFKKEGEDFVEINEEFTEEEYAKIKEQHKINVQKSRSERNENKEVSIEEIFLKYHEEDEVEDLEDSKHEIHEGYRSILTDLGIDCTDITFSKEDLMTNMSDNGDNEFDAMDDQKQINNTMNVKESNPSHNSVNISAEESDPISEILLDKSRCGDDDDDGDHDNIDEEMNTLPEVDFSSMSPILLNKHFQEDVGFQQLLTKLGFNEKKLASNNSSENDSLPVKDDFINLNDKSDISANGVGSTQEQGKTFQVTEKNQINLKKFVTWCDELTKVDKEYDEYQDDKSDHNDDGHDYSNESDDYSDGNDGDKQSSIVLNFKHSSAVPFTVNMTQTDDIIRTPADINKKASSPKSILKKSRKHVTQRPQEPQNNPQEASPAKVLTSAVSALVVERSITAPPHATPKLDNFTPRMSKFKSEMAARARHQVN